jgi:hypothetical protein
MLNCRGVDFDDDELPFYEENKSKVKVRLLFSSHIDDINSLALSPKTKSFTLVSAQLSLHPTLVPAPSPFCPSLSRT